MANYSVADAGGLLGHAERRERDDDAVGGREFAGPQCGRGLAVKAPGEFAPFARCQRDACCRANDPLASQCRGHG